MTKNSGKIKQVLGAVVDVSFEDKLPQILDALIVKHEKKDLILEDERGPMKTKLRAPIHKNAPEFIDQSTDTEVLVTGIKVVDLLAPYAKGGKIGLFGGAGVGKTV